MKNSLLAVFLGSLFLISCNQKEMKISRSDYSVVTELHDISPAYIDKDKNGNAVMNKNNLIGNTHWVLSVNRDISLAELSVFLKELTDKKHQKEGMHPDDKDIYFIYSDTLNQQNAFVKLPFRKVSLDFPPEIEPELKVRYLYNVSNIKDFEEKFSETTAIQEPYEKIYIDFSKGMKVEDFMNILIELEKENISGNVSEEVYVY